MIDEENKENNNNDAWIIDMYADDPNAEANLAKKQAAMAHARTHIKRRSNNAIEISDDKGNKLIASSEKCVDELRAQVDRQQELIKIQTAQIAFLNNKFTTIQAELTQLQEAMRFVYERF